MTTMAQRSLRVYDVRMLSWALFDLANTFFAIAMLSFYFPLWVVEDLGGAELSVSLALGLSMAGVAFLMPFCGAISDATGQRMRYLRWTTYGCVGATMLIGLTSALWLALVLFAVANAFYQLGTVFYDALLWRVARPTQLGQVSGVGASFGYLGSMLGLTLLWPFLTRGGYQATFLPAAGYFLLFALPAFFLLRDEPTRARQRWWPLMLEANRRLVQTVRAAKQLRSLWRFLWASFFSLNAINTVLIFMGIYMRKVVGMSSDTMMSFFILSQSASVAGALVLTRLIPRLGPKTTLTWIWLGWMVALGVLIARLSPAWLWFVGPGIGFVLGATWATSRVLIMMLAPKDSLAEMLGLAGLFGRASAILGPMLWGVLVLDPSGYTPAIAMLMGSLAIGLWLLQGVRVPTLTEVSHEAA